MKFAAQTLLSVSLAASFAYAQNTPNTPFRHVIIVVQENRSPDNLFGSDLHNNPRRLPNAHLATSGKDKCTGTNQTLQPMRLDTCADPDHSHADKRHGHWSGAWETTYDSGNMDGACDVRTFVTFCPKGKKPSCYNSHTCPYTYVANTPGRNGYGILEPYFQIATNYGFANWMFQTNQGPSFPAHQFLFTGTSAPDAFNDSNQNCGTLPCWQWFAAENLYVKSPFGCVADSGAVILEADPNGHELPGYRPPGEPFSDPGFPCYEHNTMTDLLENNTQGPISWRFYGYDDFKKPQGDLWNAPNAIRHLCRPSRGKCKGRDWRNGKIVLNQTRVLHDLGVGAAHRPCNLQAVSWVIPDGNWSDHPGIIGHDAGPSWVAAIVNAVGGYDNSGKKLPVQCNYWDNTVILITWDDWGGFYDDVLPWRCDNKGNCIGYTNGTAQQYVYGFRVPLLVVSAWTPKGYVSGSPNQPVAPYVHDFGSILNFTEWALGHNQQPLSWSTQTVGQGINPSYFYADYLAPDAPFSDKNITQYSLSDFFVPFTKQPRPFTQIIGAKYPTRYFLNPSAYFPTYPADPDNDVIDND
jgi:hypothetical protein